jgi:hypothetical protein
MLAVAIILFIIINWPSWLNRPLTMGSVEDKFNLVLFT